MQPNETTQTQLNFPASVPDADAVGTSAPFVHLHVHSEFSLLDGAVKIKDLVAACREQNMPAVAVTDHGNMYCAYEFYSQVKKHNDKNPGLPPLKAIIGCEFYLCREMGQKQNRDYNHLVLLAKNAAGYKNLVKLNSIAFIDGFYYRPTIDFATLSAHAEGLICLSACIAGEVPSLLLAHRFEEAQEAALRYKLLFGDDFYIELQDHGMEEQKFVNPQLVKIARDNKIKLVSTNDVHYLNKSDSEAHDVLLCVQTQSYVDEKERMRFPNSEFYLKSSEQMRALFPSVPDAAANTLEIAEKCNVKIEREQLLPQFVPADGSTPEQLFRRLTQEGLIRRYGTVTPEIQARADYEFSVISRMGFVEYYLIVWDFIRYARENGIPVGPGRGSGAGSIIAYAIGITNVEPLRYGLLFERFLNPDRVSMPDFDIDFCMDRRGEVIDYVINKYGGEHVAQIITFGTMAAKGSFKDVARAMRVPYEEADKVAKLIPNMYRGTLADAFGLSKPAPAEPQNGNGNGNGNGSASEENPFVPAIDELVKIYEADSQLRRVVDIAVRLEGSPRQTSTHAAGVVICRNPISNHVPLQRNGPDITTQFNMKEIEELGLLKVDFLGLRTLTDIDKTLKMVRQNIGKVIDFDTCTYDDPAVYALISSGETEGIFQLESGGMRRLMVNLHPESLEDITAGISLFRPGPMDSIPKYVESRHNPKKVTYLHEKLRPALEKTYGCMVYQEQIMEIVRTMAGFSLAQADIVRRAMSKKNRKEMLEQRNYFINGKEGKDAVPGAIKLGVSKKVAEAVFDEMESFCAYAFNKPHAVCYAVIAYQTAYLSLYHPVEYFACVLSDRLDHIDEVKKYVAVAQEKDIKVLPPDVNISQGHFTTENGAIRFALAAIKGAGEGAIEKIVKERERGGSYADLEDFIRRSDSIVLNKRLIEGLIKSGAFDCFGKRRREMLVTYEQLINSVAEEKRRKESGQFSMFEMLGDSGSFDTVKRFKPMPEFSPREKYSLEKEVLGMSISGSPLEEFKDKLKQFEFNTQKLAEWLGAEVDDLTAADADTGALTAQREQLVGKNVVAGGMISNLARIITKNNKQILTATLEDMYGTVNLVLFNRAYETYKSALSEGCMITVGGTLSLRDNEAPKILVNMVKIWEENALGAEGAEAAAASPAASHKPPKRRLYLRMLSEDAEQYAKIIEVLRAYEGDCPCTLVIGEQKDKRLLPLSARECHAIIYELEAILGPATAKFMEHKT